MIARTLGSQSDDPRLTAALEDYIAAIESSNALDREQFLEMHADIRAELAACLLPDSKRFLELILGDQTRFGEQLTETNTHTCFLRLLDLRRCSP